jgi:hypothetical protein
MQIEEQYRETAQERPSPTEAHHNSRSTNVAAAQRAVFGTPKLLEIIISFLPVSDILTVAQRVSRTWNNSVTKSPTVQTRLWRKSEAGDAVSPIGFLAHHKWTPKSAGMSQRPFESDVAVYAAGLVNNEIFRRHGLPGAFLRLHNGGEKPLHHCIKLPGSTLSLVSDEVRPSWLDMFLTEPPVTVARLDLQVPAGMRFGGLYSCSSASMREADGLMFGTVLAAAEKIRLSAPVVTEGRSPEQILVRSISEP